MCLRPHAKGLRHSVDSRSTLFEIWPPSPKGVGRTHPEWLKAAKFGGAGRIGGVSVRTEGGHVEAFNSGRWLLMHPVTGGHARPRAQRAAHAAQAGAARGKAHARTHSGGQLNFERVGAGERGRGGGARARKGARVGLRARARRACGERRGRKVKAGMHRVQRWPALVLHSDLGAPSSLSGGPRTRVVRPAALVSVTGGRVASQVCCTRS